jgi:hypothetical protein
MLKVSYDIPRGKNQKLRASLTGEGTRLDFYKELSYRTWESLFWVTINVENYPAFHDLYTRLVYAAGDIYSVKSAILGGVQAKNLEGEFKMVVTHSLLTWYKIHIVSVPNRTVHFEFDIRRSELINIMDQTGQYLLNSARK